MTADDDETPNEFKLHNPPTDLISAVTFSPSDDKFLLASSWDRKVRLYDIKNNKDRSTIVNDFPILDCCFQGPVNAWIGDLGGTLKVFDLNTESGFITGKHDAAIKCVEYSPDVQLLITGSWDSSVKLWDPKSKEIQGTYQLPDKVYTMAVCGANIIIGTAGRRVLIYDLRNMSFVQQRRESSLKYQTRCIRAFPNKQGFALSSIEGRVAVEYIDPDPEIQKRKFAFKCHRIKDSSGVELIYPVNAIAFHDNYNTFATGGSDGYVNIWDGFNRKRLCQFHRYPNQISSLAFNPSGTFLAISSSCIDDFEQKDKLEDAIYIRNVTDHETKPK